MFDIGWSELLIVGVIALIVIGPRELPGVLRMVGQWMGKVRRMAADFQGQFQEAMREAEMADLKKQVDDFTQQADDLTASFDPLETVRNEVDDVNAAIDGSTRAPAGDAASLPRPDAETSAPAAHPSRDLEPGAAEVAPSAGADLARPEDEDRRSAERAPERTAGGVSS